MPKFEQEYVHFTWTDELEGKKVVGSDNPMILEKYVKDINRDSFGVVSYSSNDIFPFRLKDRNYRFVYYDPNYKAKVAHEQGKVIQKKIRHTGEWMDITAKNIDWKEFEWNGIELRVKPEESKPVTTRELARWLAMGNGEGRFGGNGTNVFNNITYSIDTEDSPVTEYFVRKWKDTEWHEPTREYLGLED